jgi:hypothetical protein
LAVAPLAVSAATSGAPAGAQAVESIEVQFTTVGTSEFPVPADVHCLAVDAIGGSGGASAGNEGSNGGSPGEVSGTIVVAPGESLQVNVGGAGGDAVVGTGGAGGSNGGGDGGSPSGETPPVGGGGGGGASDVRHGGTSLADRVVVAAGGGGGGAFGNQGGSGGDPGFDGQGGATAAGGGGADGSTPGAGGVLSNPLNAANGGDGALGIGGDGGAASTDSIRGGGGGGGAGYAGGGGGAGVADSGAVENAGAAGAGGGGSNLAPSGASSFSAEWAGDGQVVLSYVTGDLSCLAAPLTIAKSLAGAPLPAAGTEFSVAVACDDDTIYLPSLGGSGVSDHATVDFVVGTDGTAHAVGSDTMSFVGPTQCTVTEPVAGGASSTTFTCVGDEAGNVVPEPGLEPAASWNKAGASAIVTPDSPICPAPGPSADSILVNIVHEEQTATVTATNTFAAAAAVVTPKFTG